MRTSDTAAHIHNAPSLKGERYKGIMGVPPGTGETRLRKMPALSKAFVDNVYGAMSMLKAGVAHKAIQERYGAVVLRAAINGDLP